MTIRAQYQRDHQRGFTLAELMIALLVFSFVAATGVYTLRLGVESRDQLGAADERIRDIQIMRALLKQDFLQVTSRPVKDQFGEPQPASFYGGASHLQRPEEGEQFLISFVRNGWVNPGAEEARSTLQYVQYILRNGDLIRRVRPFLDGARNQPVAERVLLSGLQAAQAEFLRGEINGRYDWASEWPSAGALNTEAPGAVALTLNHGQEAPLRMLYLVGGAP